jgi:malonyl-CoA O-methyltransferase
MTSQSTKAPIASSFNHLWRRRNRIDLKRYLDQSAVSAEIFYRLMDRLDCINLSPKKILNLSINPDLSALLLHNRYPEAQLLTIDLSLPLLKKTADLSVSSLCCASPESLPLADGSVDLLVVHLSLSQYPDALSLLDELARVLAPQGQLMLSHYGLDTLKELRLVNESLNAPFMLNHFIDMHHFGDALMQSSFQFPVVDMELIEVGYESLVEMFQDLRGMGGYVDPNQWSAVQSQKMMAQCMSAYQDLSLSSTMNMSVEVVYAHAVAGSCQNTRLPDGSVAIPVDVLTS